MNSTDLPRRSLAKGAAWAVPAIAVAGAAPAVAGSNLCTPTVSFSGGVRYDWGTIGAATTTQAMDVGGQTTVTGLPSGVTVKSIQYDFWIENRMGQGSYGPGAFWVGNPSSSRASSCSQSAQTCGVMTYPTSGTSVNKAPWTRAAGWSGSYISTGNQQQQTYSDAAGNVYSYKMWNLQTTWSDANGAGTTGTSGGCGTFDSGPSGRFGITYTNMTGVPVCSDPNAIIHNVVYIKVTLSNGQVLPLTSADNGATRPRC